MPAQLLPHQVRNAVSSQLDTQAGILAACDPVPPSLGSLIQGAGSMPWEWVMPERLLYAQAWPNVSLGKGCPSALHLPSGWISWDRSDVPGERICAPLWFKFFPRREWWLEKAMGRRKDFLPMRCSTGTGQGLEAASAPSSP